MLILLAVALLVIVLDQLSKAWVVANVSLREARPVIQGFARLRYTQNSGAAFGFFQGWTGALSIAAVAVVIAIFVSASRSGSNSRLTTLALGLVVGGALGNLVDRIRLGYVVDFFEVYGPQVRLNNTVYTFPVFNLADSAITVGVLLLLAGLLFSKEVGATKESSSTALPQDISAWQAAGNSAGGASGPEPEGR
ncbi:MAG: signal peptidase II [Chloroflexota bacterium]|nr:signal peptidase II [Chloroflexota bacterium]